ncbi:cytochrome-c oxidase, cbb3-type subunit II [Aurantimonas marianensis]|uniref:Cytochrome-c oxidase, cbb3-type subunit II n=1 Tax=Aurantimonas marianensis TaxID=2920428 RepID=A0A9X2KE43_9HYPH|nr:cytochrome-c oxidase, cbb3-type subunit II [Aurantimonas marianensis]MCP3054041.1 cytochrome-c oxidase, cbb3-type subunit II [Aurantimonas marianensis]
MSKKDDDSALKGALPEVKADPIARGILSHHGKIERNATLLLVLSLLVVSIGGVVEIAPLFYLENTIEKVEGVRPYSPLELAGRNIYIREGCYTCHSQMIRPFRDEVERYGPYSLAAESMYDHPFQWGSKRTGPDLARVGGRYSDEWQVRHLIDPRSVVPESVMPTYAFLLKELVVEDPAGHLIANRRVGVPYTDAMIENARADLRAQADPEADTAALLERYPKAVVSNFDGDRQKLTEMDALVAYLQMLGTLVDFAAYKPELNDR